MNISTVKEVIGVAVKKNGTEIRGSKNGKDWAMYTVILENGIKLNVFGPVKVGDVVYELKQDPQYHTWQGKVKPAGSTIAPNNLPDMSQPTNAQIMEAVRKTYSLVLEVQKKLNEELSTDPYEGQTPDKKPDILPDDDFNGEEIDIKTLDIPFNKD